MGDESSVPRRYRPSLARKRAASPEPPGGGDGRVGSYHGPLERPIVGLRHHPAAWIVPIIMLVLAMGHWPYGFYVLMRFVVCSAAGFLAWQQWSADNRLSGWVVVLAVICFLFNPVVPIHLTREIWRVFDLAAAVAFLLHLRSVRAHMRRASLIERSDPPSASELQRRRRS